MRTDIIYNFLDKYVGDGININPFKTPYYDPILLRSSLGVSYSVKSDNETTIMFLHKNRIGGVTPIYSAHLIQSISNVFSESKEQCREYLRSWFCKKYKINDYKELLEYIKHD